MKIRKSTERGQVDHGWLQAKHSFSFASYRDEEWTNFGALCVLNEDRIAPGRGFDMHSHENMEIITILHSGQMKHRDDLGNEHLLNVGEVQVMTAGTGIRHSEWNPSESEEAHLYQIWIHPEKLNLKPDYNQLRIDENQDVLVSKHDGGLYLNQQARLSYGELQSGENKEWHAMGQKVYLQLIEGKVQVAEQLVESGDALLLSDERVELRVLDKTKFLEIRLGE